MEMQQVVCAVLVVLLGGLLQGTVAFGFGLLSVPLLLGVGFSMPMVLAIASICTAVQSGSGVHHLSHAVPWRVVGTSFVVRSAAMLAGIWTLSRLVSNPISRIKFWVGLVMLLMVILQATWRPKPRPRLHRAWDMAAFLSSGFTGGLCSMGGPPLVLWVMAHDWTADRTRAFLFASFMSLVPLQLAVLYWTFGGDVLRGIGLGAALSPAVLLGSMAGLRIGSRLSKPLLRGVAFVVLGAIALNSMYPQVMLWAKAR